MIKLGAMPRRLFQRVFHAAPAAKHPWEFGATTLLDFDADHPDLAEAETPTAGEPDPDHPSPEATPAGPSANPDVAPKAGPASLETAMTTARTLAEQGHFEIAEATLEQARQRFPDSPVPLIEYARIAETKRDWVVMAARYTVLRIRFPDEVLGYAGGAHALRELGRLDEADVLLEAAMSRFRDEPSVFVDYGRLAELRKDWQGMAERFAEVRQRFPDHGLGYTGRARALSMIGRIPEAEALLEAGQQRLPNEATLFVDHARMAELRHDWIALESRCAALRERFPDEPWPYAGGAIALRNLGRYDEVDALLTDADLRFPINSAFWVEYARSADDRGDWEEAISRCKVICEQFPDVPWGYVGGANALDHLGRRDEARLLMESGLARVPAEADPFGAYCWLAQNRQEWPEAITRWEGYRRRFPDRAVGYAAESIALRELSRFDEAESLVLEGLRRHPDDSELRANHAFVATARKDWERALERWQAYVDRYPDHAVGYIHAGIALRELARFAEADAILREALRQFPDDSEIIGNFAWNAHHKRDWLEALRRWKIYCERFPQDPLGPEQAKLVLQELGYYDDARNAPQLGHQSIVGQLCRELYGGDSPLAHADPQYVDAGYPHTNLRPELIESILDAVRPRFWLELGSMLGGSAIRTAAIIKAQMAPTEIVCIDPFTGDVNMWAREQPKKHAGEWQFLRLERGRPTIYERFLANVTTAGHDDIILPIAATSIVGIRLLRRLADEQRLAALPDVIYLDSAHEPDETFLELRNCWDLLQPGGVLMGDDWDWDAVRNDVLRFVETVRLNYEARQRLAERHPRFVQQEGVLLDRGQWVLTK
ncbi:MAG: tetratricopeptide repeat protein [Acetobacteraceae bacterium]|jgi:tetratricopeptide (TPR) repeat protein/predicted O-methyltransferase YrrM